jgi:hippurate hydrolase
MADLALHSRTVESGDLLAEARDHLDDAVELRRTLHRWPEVGNDLPITREQVLGALEGLPLDVTLHDTTSGIAAVLTGTKPGPTVLLRGDMDALPMPEETGLDFASNVDGAMHACGHDTHTAMLVATAKLLSGRRDEIAGRVLFMFQPGEEGHHGARFMLDEGLLDVGPLPDGTPSPVQRAFAIHITSMLPSGAIAARRGPMMAASDVLRITITGAGGHASAPHQTLDPVPVACEIVGALQTMITRRIDVFDPSVVTVAKIWAGTANNVIPESAYLEGTIRTFSEATRRQVHDGIHRVADGIAAAHGMTATAEVIDGFPVTVNDDEAADFALGLAAHLVGDDRTIRMPNPVMGAEDFSYVLNRLPGAMLFLGGTPADRDPRAAAPNHSPHVYFDEAAMTTGIATYSALALETLAAAAG